MKLCLSHYDDAKFESGSFSGFGYMTSQNVPEKKGTSHQIRIWIQPLDKITFAENPGAHFTSNISANQRFGTCAYLTRA